VKRYSFKAAEQERVLRSLEQYAEVIPDWDKYPWQKLLVYGDLYVEPTGAIYVGASSTDPETAGVLLLGDIGAAHVKSAVTDALDRWSFRRARVVLPDLVEFYRAAGFSVSELIDTEALPTIALELTAQNIDVGEELNVQQSHNGNGRHTTVRSKMAGAIRWVRNGCARFWRWFWWA
jgi:hypothetical protein